MKTINQIAQLLKLEQFRRERIELFKCFVGYAALSLSVKVDPVHRTERLRRLERIRMSYSREILDGMAKCLRTLAEDIIENTDAGKMEDILGRAYEELGLCDKGQDFTFPDVGKLIGVLGIIGEPSLPERGFFDLYEHACGSGSIVLCAAGQLQDIGFDYTRNLVVYANDVDEMCVHMAYTQISLHGIPAIVAKANTITNQEFERWYTPQYILGQWITRRPFSGNDAADYLLKCGTVPHYTAVQQALKLERPPDNKGDDLNE